MGIIIYDDNKEIKVLDESANETKTFESNYIKSYIKNSVSISDKNMWKHSGEGARFREDARVFRTDYDYVAYINSLNIINDEEAIYSFSVGDISGIYKKNIVDGSESHIIHSNEFEYLGLDYLETEDLIACTVKGDYVTSNIGIINTSSNDISILTDGDTLDENPSFSKTNPDTIYYNSKGAGRDRNGNFIQYGNAVINELNIRSKDITEIYGKADVSCIKPQNDSKGNLYFIECPTKPKKKGNIFLDILFAPVRFILAIFNFFELFTRLFTGTSMTSSGDNPAKGREKNSQEMFIDGNMIEIDKEYKKNQKNKDKNPGIIPSGWTLTSLQVSGESVPIKSGIVSYAILADDSIICTNGKHIFKIKDGVTKKLASAALCLKLSSNEIRHGKAYSPFDI